MNCPVAGREAFQVDAPEDRARQARKQAVVATFSPDFCRTLTDAVNLGGILRRRQSHGLGCGQLAARNTGVMTILKSVLLFTLAAVAEIGGAWLIWQAVREDKAWWWAGLGIVALGLYGFVAAFQPDAHFGRVLAAYGGVFIVGSLAWGMLLDGFRPDRWDLIGAAVCLVGVAVIMFAPRQG
jgi:small multidrug resistance family-3 protein